MAGVKIESVVVVFMEQEKHNLYDDLVSIHTTYKIDIKTLGYIHINKIY